MPMLWHTRLTPKGYHATAVKRVDTASRWEGATRVGEDGLVEGDAILAFDADDESQQRSLRVGDAVYLSGARKGAPAEIAVIDSFVASKEGDIYLFGTWFWRPERMRLPDAVEWHQAELFLQVGADPDENSACAIELTAVVVTELQDPSQLTETPHTFFWRRTYNVETKEISALPVPLRSLRPPRSRTDPPASLTPVELARRDLSSRSRVRPAAQLLGTAVRRPWTQTRRPGHQLLRAQRLRAGTIRGSASSPSRNASVRRTSRHAWSATPSPCL